MVLHSFVCDNCNIEVTDTNTDIIHKCPKCNKDMRWDININSGSRGQYYHVSESLAINPSQIREHNQMFPDIEVLSDGRLEFRSVKQQDDYIEKCGFVKHPQKIRGHIGVKRIYSSRH